MIKSYTSLFLGFALIVFFIQYAHADVWIPDHEYVGFFDSNGVYQVVGAVKNSENYPVIPTISISIQDGENIISKDFEYVSIMPEHEIPFKYSFPEVKGLEPILNKAEISFIHGIHNNYAIKVMYDETLIVHPDGHITGRIINTGTQTVSDVRLLAVIHGYDHAVLDMGENISPIVDMKPGEIRDFVMYPDPSVKSDVWYYSCFAIGDLSVITLNAQRNDETFTIRYDSRMLISYPEFDESGESISFRMDRGWPLQTYVNFEFPRFSNNEEFDESGESISFRMDRGWPLQTYVNFEFPRFSNNEEFTVYLDDEKIDSIQSIDEMGNWHVAFTVEDQTSGNLVITGFDPEATQTIETMIPDWVRNNAGWWSQEKISDEDFVSGIEFLIERELIQVPITEKQSTDSEIPTWIRNNAGWWSQNLISDEDFISGLQFLIKRGIVSV